MSFLRFFFTVVFVIMHVNGETCTPRLLYAHAERWRAGRQAAALEIGRRRALLSRPSAPATRHYASANAT
jgi:hypothetical protein